MLRSAPSRRRQLPAGGEGGPPPTPALRSSRSVRCQPFSLVEPPCSGVEVDFPYDAYPCQLDYMTKVVQALQQVRATASAAAMPADCLALQSALGGHDCSSWACDHTSSTHRCDWGCSRQGCCVSCRENACDDAFPRPLLGPAAAGPACAAGVAHRHGQDAVPAVRHARLAQVARSAGKPG